MKSRKVLIASVLVVVFVSAGGVFAYSRMNVSDDEIFRKYVIAMASAETLAQEETYKGTGSETKTTGILEVNNKKFQLVGEVKCDGAVDGNPITIDATITQDGANTYLRLDNAAGTASDSDGKPVDLMSAYVNVKGKWYTVSEENKAIKAMLDNDTYIFNSSVVAPDTDKEKVADTLISKKAFTYSSITKDGENYVIKFQSHRTEYQDAIEELFPEVSNVDLILDTIFADSSTEESTITVDKTGKFIKETLTEANPCAEVFSTYVGSEQDDQAAYISGENMPIEESAFSFPDIKDTKPIESLVEDIVI